MIAKFAKNVFQSTHPRRVRPTEPSVKWQEDRFQSTHPRRVRPVRRLSGNHREGFNPRTHVGCDIRRLELPSAAYCFNPRTHVGCDSNCQNSDQYPKQFQSTHPRRVRLSQQW